MTKEELKALGLTDEFPSPYWGLFFSYEFVDLNKMQINQVFPSPYWGLFFYLTNAARVNTYSKPILVSVPILGIIFLSYRT